MKAKTENILHVNGDHTSHRFVLPNGFTIYTSNTLKLRPRATYTNQTYMTPSPITPENNLATHTLHRYTLHIHPCTTPTHTHTHTHTPTPPHTPHLCNY